MAISFHAELVDVSRRHGVWIIGWTVSEDLTAERYLLLQRDDDPIMGAKGVYIECCNQGWSWYGHIISFELLRDRVLVQLDVGAAQRMRDDGRIEVTFNSSDERFAELQNALNYVFDGYRYYKSAAA